MTLQKKSDHTEYVILDILHYCNSNVSFYSTMKIG